MGRNTHTAPNHGCEQLAGWPTASSLPEKTGTAARAILWWRRGAPAHTYLRTDSPRRGHSRGNTIASCLSSLATPHQHGESPKHHVAPNMPPRREDRTSLVYLHIAHVATGE